MLTMETNFLLNVNSILKVNDTDNGTKQAILDLAHNYVLDSYYINAKSCQHFF